MKFRLPYPVVLVLEKLDKAGFEAYLVGGSVRDLLLRKKNILDWDFTTNATPEQIMSIIDESFYDNNFGTVMVAPSHLLKQMTQETKVFTADYFKDLDVFDITTFRSESGYSDKRRPDKVKWGRSLEEDVKRRDFTINAMAVKAKSEKRKVKNGSGKSINVIDCEVELIDYFGGMDDLKKKLIRTVGDANERFGEDALRMIRAIRLGAELAFGIETETLEAIGKNAKLVEVISKERVRDELLKILASDYPADGVMLMFSSGLLKYVLPEVLEACNVPQGGHHIYDVFKHMIESLRECPSRDPIVRLATLLHDVGKPRTMRKQGPRGVTFYGHEVVGSRMVNRISHRLRLSKKQRDKLFVLVRWHMFTYDPKMTDAAIRRFIKRVGRENINDMMMLRIGDRKGGGSKATSWRLRELQERIGENLYEPMSVVDLKINGNELMKVLKIKPGPKVGEILEQMFEEVMDDKLDNNKKALERRAIELNAS